MNLAHRDLKSLPLLVIKKQLEDLLDPVLSPRRTADESAAALAKCSRHDQQFVLNWLRVITKTNSEMGYQFVAHAPRALKLMDQDTAQDWVLHAMDVYDQDGLYPGSEALASVEEFNSYIKRKSIAANLHEIEGVLSRYIRGLSGRTLRIAENNSDEWFTDTETIWLPPEIHRYMNKQANFGLYKVVAALLWAQIHHGTFRRAMPNAKWLSERFSEYPDPERARQIFNTLETYRLDACITRELPGLAREMNALMKSEAKKELTPTWNEAINILENKESSVSDTLDQLVVLYGDAGTIPSPKPWQGILYPEKVEEISRGRIARESSEVQRWADSAIEKTVSDKEISIVEASINDDQNFQKPKVWKIQSGNKLITVPEHVSNIFKSTLLDFETIPRNYLLTEGEGDWLPYEVKQTPLDDSVTNTPNHLTGYYYDEWDFQRLNYRKNWCFLREIDMQPSQEPVVEQTLEKYSGLVLEIRRTFEAIRNANRRLRRQTSGDEIDVEALVEAQTQARAGHEASNQLFISSRRLDRDTAVMFMVDISGSTKGWINSAERESLVLLCEAVEILGDQYAIYAFSGMTRKRCELYRIKSFNEAYSEDVKKRIAGIEPKDYTRMGVIIRHLTKLLEQQEARTRILLTLSDGKPDDYDGYRGQYGVEDTRQAIIEARRAGIIPFCITIDSTARDYLPHMYGEAGYTVVSEVRKLPKRVSEIYRRLTT